MPIDLSRTFLAPFLLLLMDLVTTLEHLLRMDTSSGLADTCQALQ